MVDKYMDKLKKKAHKINSKFVFVSSVLGLGIFFGGTAFNICQGKFNQKLKTIKNSIAQFFSPIKDFWPHLKKFLLKAFTVFVGVTAFSVILVTVELISNSKTMPNLTMASLDLGYQNINDVEAKLKNNFDNFLN